MTSTTLDLSKNLTDPHSTPQSYFNKSLFCQHGHCLRKRSQILKKRILFQREWASEEHSMSIWLNMLQVDLIVCCTQLLANWMTLHSGENQDKCQRGKFTSSHTLKSLHTPSNDQIFLEIKLPLSLPCCLFRSKSLMLNTWRYLEILGDAGYGWRCLDLLGSAWRC